MSHSKRQSYKVFKGLFMVCAVYICYIFLNLFNQKIHKQQYQRIDGTGYDYFRQQASMNCLISFTCTTIGFIWNKLFPPKQRTNIPKRVICKQSLLMFTSSCFVNKSLNYVSFIMVSMIKSCSLISVVFVGIFFTRVKNQKNKMPSSKIIVAILVVTGILIFQTHGNKTIEESIPVNQFIGFTLLIISIIADGLLPDYQAQMKQKYNPTTMEHYQQSHRYLFLLAFIVSGLNGGLFNTFHFWYTHHRIFYYCLFYVIFGSLGHIFIFGLIKNFSQLLVPLVLAIRKIISVVVSVLWFQHKLNFYQYIGVLFVFSGAIYQALDKPKNIKNSNKQIASDNKQ